MQNLCLLILSLTYKTMSNSIVKHLNKIITNSNLPDQMNMAMFFWLLVKVDANVRCCTIAYTGQVIFHKAPETQGHV